jgi:hypothetical protein
VKQFFVLLFIACAIGGHVLAAVYDVKQDNTGHFRTVQECASSSFLSAGDTCLVHPGTYSEHVATAKGGSAGNFITFKTQGTVEIEGFRIRHPYIRIEGFDITKYPVGLNMGHITIEPEGHHCHIINNNIRDGVQLLSNNYFFNGPARTITHSAGGFLAAGFKPGTKIYIASNIRNLIRNHDVVRTIKSVTDTVITLADNETLLSEGPVHSLLYATRTGKTGVRGIAFMISSSRGAANYSLIQGNRLSNLGGSAMDIAGSNHIIENNIIEKMNGWQIFDVIGSHNVFRRNYIRNSPRYAGFEHPDGSVDQSTGKYWDFVSQTIRGFGNPSTETVNTIFEYNFIEKIDNQFVNINEKMPGYSGAIPATRRFIFRNNVVFNLEMHGAFHRPETIVVNNTFYKANFFGSGQVFMVSGATYGSADGSIIKNNVFVENGNVADVGRNAKGGWYGLLNVVMGEAPNFNFVAGPQHLGFPAKAGFDEVNGINGGDPQFVNINNPVGPDGIPFTADDGLRPRVGSILCTSGEGGVSMGAYTCDDAPFSPKIVSQPRNRIVGVGQTARFSMLAAAFPEPEYQWLKDGVVLADSARMTGSKTAVLTINDAEYSDAGSYRCVIHNSEGSATSNIVTLTVQDEPVPEEPGTGGDAGFPTGFDSFKNIFNPTKDAPLNIVFNLNADSLSLVIYDRKGNLVRRLHDGAHAVGMGHEKKWDGRNEIGQIVAAGIYQLHLKVGATTRTRKIVVIK